ncbi:hypothetical protein DN34_3189 [Vibrio cholerae]|nr:hypothetical protein DN34_3189 [Vibrio cholerae]
MNFSSAIKPRAVTTMNVNRHARRLTTLNEFCNGLTPVDITQLSGFFLRCRNFTGGKYDQYTTVR